jgi:hypothetical protein
MKAGKTFKIGEYCIGGVIEVKIISDTTILIINKDWDMSAGFGRGSSQKNAKVLASTSFNVNDGERNVSDYLCYLTTSYYADTIIEWIKSKGVKFTSANFW